MDILIAVPTFETIYPDTYKAIWELDKGGHNVQFDFVRGYDCATARNKIVQLALDRNVDYVLMVDNDTILPKDALVNLLDSPVDVCLGYYVHRNPSNRYDGRLNICKLGWFNYPAESQYTAAEMKQLLADQRTKFKIHGGGMGCALIKTDVFRRISYPYYDWVNYPDDNRGMLSEDLYFCEQCRVEQIPIYSDARVGCGHILRHAQWPE